MLTFLDSKSFRSATLFQDAIHSSLVHLIVFCSGPLFFFPFVFYWEKLLIPVYSEKKIDSFLYTDLSVMKASTALRVMKVIGMNKPEDPETITFR